MSEMVTTGTWQVNPGNETEFIDAWSSFAQWACTMPGAETLRLGRDLAEPLRYVSYGGWDDADSAHAWKSSSEFRDRIARVLQYVDDFMPAELDVVAIATHKAAAVGSGAVR